MSKRAAWSAAMRYAAGQISLSRAARLAGMDLADFIAYLGSLSIPVIQGDAETLTDELENFRKWKDQRGPAQQGSQTVDDAFIDIPAGHFARLKTPSGNCIALLIDAIDVRAPDGRPALLALIDPDEPMTAAAHVVRRSHEPEDLGTFESYLEQGEHREICSRIIENTKDLPHSLLIVRSIEWVKARGGLQAYDSSLICRQALAAVRRELDRDREILHTLGEILAGMPRNESNKKS